MAADLNYLLDVIEKSGRQYDIEKIKSAYHLAEKMHEGQKRSSGEPYIIHPVEVAVILVGLGMDSDTLVAGLLHDVVEDTSETLDDIERIYGHNIAQLVDGVTKITTLDITSLDSKEQQQAENVRKMLLAMSQDIRVIIIKLADRLHNLRTLQYRPRHKQLAKARETMEVYAPIAHRLGIRAVKEEMEDLSLRYLDPIAYSEIETALNSKKDERLAFLEKIKEQIRERMSKEGSHIHLEGRVKSVYGIYRKMYLQGKAFEEIYDIYAVRIIVDTVDECYNTFGIIHDMYTPLPNRFKDYISTPKPNMYQSLHTTVIGKEGIPFEVQIRTWEMHHTAEYGIAAHWKYKAGLQGKDKLEERLEWVRHLLEAQQDSEDVEDILSSIKSDLVPEEVFVFTPKGDVIDLPSGSTVIDFAYAIHSAVGNSMIGAKVDGRIVPIDYQVKTGQIVEIATTKSQAHGPNRDWLQIVKTSEARNKIRSWFKKEKKEENIAQGRAEIERDFKRDGINLTEEQYEQFILELAHRQHCRTVDEFYAAVGYGGISLSKILPRIKEDYLKRYRKEEKPDLREALPKRPVKRGASSGVIVEGYDDCLVKFARCCNPVPGDAIIGFITRGYGVSIHKQDCPNIISAMKDDENCKRLVQVQWASYVGEAFKATFEVVAEDHGTLLADVSVQLANMRVPIHELNARKLKDGNVQMTITVTVTGLDQLNLVIKRIQAIKGVSRVRRSGK